MTSDIQHDPPALRVAALAVDCEDPAALAGFWGDLLGGTVELDLPGGATVHAPGLVAIDFLPVPEAKTVKNRLHLDLRGVSYEGAVQRAVELGATRADDVYAGEGWQVLRDPEGNEFCILSKPYTD